MTISSSLTREQIRAFYDRFGAKQDKQGFYEDIALAKLTLHGGFEPAMNIVEVGCGTGRFAESLLRDYLGPEAVYWGCDVSKTMLRLTQQRLLPFGERVVTWRSPGEGHLPLPNASADRFISNYVFDILSGDEIHFLIAEARRILIPEGLICLVSLTKGERGISKLVTALWNLMYALNPLWVGGCRAIELRSFLPDVDWEILHRSVVVGRGISSEVIVAKKVGLSGSGKPLTYSR